MKYHFIYPDIGTGFHPDVHHGLAQLSAVLKTNGDEVSLHHVTREPSRKSIMDAIGKSMPNVVGFTVTSNQAGYVKQWSSWIKDERPTIPIICGGVHATLCPDDLISTRGIDAVCVGEGESAILEMKFRHCQQYPLVDLNSLPFPDYSIFDMKRIMRTRDDIFAVIASRGCPYQCSYCCNHALAEKAKGLGTYFRFRSVDNTLDMLEHYRQQYPVRGFSFADDIFGTNTQWVEEFCAKYPGRIGLPFECNMRVERVTSKLLKLMKDAGCRLVEMGIESGCEMLRREMLNRKMTNKQILDAFEQARDLGIRTRSYNMIGIPHETESMTRETISLNRAANPDEVAVFYYYPFPGTRMYDLCVAENIISSRKATGYTADSVLDLPTISRRDLHRLYKEFVRFSVAQEAKNYRPVIRLGIRVVSTALRIITTGHEAGVMRNTYVRMRKVLRWLQRGK